MSEPLKARKTKKLKDGSYNGKIISFARDTETYDYMRYKIEVENEDMTLEVSYPTDISYLEDGKPSSSHAKFLVRMGIELNDKFDYLKIIEQKIIEQDVTFLVQNVEKENKKTKELMEFSQIVRSSVKPRK